SLIKSRMRDSESKVVVDFDRIWGALTSVVNLLVVLSALGGFLLCLIQTCVGLELSFFQKSLWTNFCAKHVADLLLVLFLVGAFRGGYKLGLIKSIWLLLGLFATGAAFFGSFYLVSTVGFLTSFAGTVAGAFQGLGGGVASALWKFIVTLLCVIVMAAVLVLLFWLFNMLVKKLNRSRAFTAIDNSVLAVILFVLAVLLVCLAHLGISFFSQAVGGILGGTFEVYFNGLGEVFCSSPLSKIFYEFNPLMRLFVK
ncbi:MAG: hypothetical protein K2N74_05065, partial [Clostridiales bacterium]|nr:hypothetical protein [Clostridiales bacterium]